MRVAVLLGGGFKGEAQAAELARFEERGVSFDATIGESAGALNAVSYAAVGAETTLGIWDTLGKADNVYRLPIGGVKVGAALTALGMRDGIYDLAPLRRTLEGFFAAHRLQPGRTAIPLVADLDDRVVIGPRLDCGSDAASIAVWTWRSCLVPFAHAIDMGRFADGGVMTDPFSAAFSLRPDEIDLFVIGPLDVGSHLGGFTPLPAALRAVELIRWTRLLDSLLLAARVNASPGPGERRVTIWVHWCEAPLGDWMTRTPALAELRRSAPWQVAELEDLVPVLKRLRSGGSQ